MSTPDQQRPRGELDRIIRRLIRKNAEYASTGAFAKMTIVWQAGKLELVTEERHYKAAALTEQTP